MRRDTLPTVTLRGRHAGELLAHPCACGRPQCTIGEHVYDSTRDMAPGPKAQSFEPAIARGLSLLEPDADPPSDRTAHLWQDYQTLLTAYLHAADDLTRFIDAHRPDRLIPLPQPASDDQWCANHLTCGMCEPRFRGDLCRFCYDFGLAFGAVPDVELMRARKDHGYSRDRDVKAWRERQPKPSNKKNRSRLANYG